MKRVATLVAALFLLLASTTWSQQLSKRITNKDVIDMVGLGLSDDVMRPVAEALRSLTPTGAGGEGALRGPGGSAKLAGGENIHGKGDLERCDACRE